MPIYVDGSNGHKSHEAPNSSSNRKEKNYKLHQLRVLLRFLGIISFQYGDGPDCSNTVSSDPTYGRILDIADSGVA
jgi:hypothetical protein